MQSKMTEKEFRNELRRLYEIAAPEEVVVVMIKRAGLEFAPEPVRLPECLVVNFSGGRRRAKSSSSEAWCFELVEVSRDVAATQGRMQEEREAVFDAAVDRYNAYPGLRAAAEALHGEMVKLWPDPDTYGLCLKACLRQLGAELAKGPKP